MKTDEHYNRDDTDKCTLTITYRMKWSV